MLPFLFNKFLSLGRFIFSPSFSKCCWIFSFTNCCFYFLICWLQNVFLDWIVNRFSFLSEVINENGGLMLHKHRNANRTLDCNCFHYCIDVKYIIAYIWIYIYIYIHTMKWTFTQSYRFLLFQYYKNCKSKAVHNLSKVKNVKKSWNKI